MIGQTILHYRILDKLGEGGMGVVYKAEDTKLQRIVAIKMLPERVNQAADAKARFLQEAQSAAGLNHPNICTIHGVDEAEGSLFIVMEYIEGGTLRDKIPFAKTDDAISAAIQIGEAMQEAHAKGIVHRDIKADNIMLTAKGQAKVMDFGLAKLKGSLKLTRTSSTVGTLGYMAPEQIQGGEVDHRSDIFSFGVLFFEMLTGKLPFRGEHEAAMVYSIVNEEPQAIDQLLPDLSPIVVNLIQRCLEKDPNDRYQHFDDIVVDLRRSQKKTSKIARSSAYFPTQSPIEQPFPTTASSTEVPRSTARKRKPLIIYSVTGGTLAIVAMLIWMFLFRTGVSLNPDMTTRVLQVPFTQFSYPGLSPDGNWIAFPAADVNDKWDIYFMNTNGGEPRRITSDATAYSNQSVDISPDGSQIAYARLGDDRKTIDIFVVSALGGTSRKLAAGAVYPLWKPDGKRIGFMRTSDSQCRSESGMMEFWSLDAVGSDARKEYTDSLFVTKGGNYRFCFCWSPDGNSIGWIRSLSSSSQVIIVRNLKTGQERQLTDGNENIDSIVWTVDGQIIFSSNRGGNTNLWTIPASGGKAIQITKGGGPDIGISVSHSGKSLVYLQQQRVGYLWTENIDGSSPRQISFDDREVWEPTFSPDGKQIAFVMRDPDPLKNNSDLYVEDADGNNRRRLTIGNTITRVPVFSPDGDKILYSVPPTNMGSDTSLYSLYVVDVENPGPPKLVGHNFGLGWIDNDHVLISNTRASYLGSLSGDSIRPFFKDSSLIWSFWDMRHLAYYDLHPDRRGWWVVETDKLDGTALWNQKGNVVMPTLKGTPRKVSSSPSFVSTWTSFSSSSGFVIQYAGPNKIRRIWFNGHKEEILPATFSGLINRSIDVSRDGKAVVFVTPRLSSRLVLLSNVFK